MQFQSIERVRLGLGDVLQQLSSDAKDLFVSRLQRQGDVKSMRATSRSVRELVDGSIQSLTYTVSPMDKALREGGALPPFSRFTRCNQVALQLDGSVFEHPQEEGYLIASVFVDQPLEVRQRVHNLTLDETVYGPVTALSSLLRSLPALRSVHLRDGLPKGVLEYKLAYDALASLPNLEELRLPARSSLAGVDRLAGQLRRLVVYGCPEGRGYLDESSIRSITRLHRLEQLTVQPTQDDMRCLLQLLRDIPHSVTELKLLVGVPLAGSASLRLRNGRVTQVSVTETTLFGLTWLVGEVLYPSGAVPLMGPPTLERISLGSVRVSATDSNALTASQLERLRAVVTRSSKATTHSVFIERGVPYLQAHKILSVLGTVGDIEFRLFDSVGIGMRVFPRNAVPPPLAAGALPPPADGSSVAPPSLVPLALEIMLAAAAAKATPASEAIAAAMTALTGNDADSIAKWIASIDGWSPMLLLRGPLLAGLAWAPGALHAWVEKLMLKAAETEESVGPVADYLPLHNLNCMLLCCGSTAEARAVSAAALEAAEAAAKSGLSAAGGGAAALLQVLPAAVPDAATSFFRDRPRILGSAFAATLSVVAQSVLDGAEGFSSGWSGQQRMQWLLEQWGQLLELNSAYPA